MINEFKNKTILITGGSSGIGLNLINFFLKQNAKIINVSRRKPGIKNKNLKHLNFDLTNFNKYDSLMKKVPKMFGLVDYFIHAAGIHFIKPVRIISDADIDRTIDINLNTNCFKNNLNSIYLPDTILEFKFPHKYEQYFRSFFNNRSYNLRSQKYSKYVRSLGALENSGYKI